ncbi:hypothetical protein E4U54_003011 [Claviceps lovelessii]|nr:hypothetical protein E4U54_003011 [Claviceps lovelessii]
MEEFACFLALKLHLLGFVALVSKLFDALVQADAEVVGRDAEDLANRGRDARRVGVDVVELRELRGDLGG